MKTFQQFQEWCAPDGSAYTGAPSKSAIAVHMGFKPTRDSTPSFLQEPDFSRAVEFERIRRVVQGSTRMTKDEIAVLASMIARAGMIEAARRFVVEPGKISTRDLLAETRNYARLAADVGPEGQGDRGVHQTINVFFEAAARLPPRAREKFLGMYDDSMKRMALAAGEARQKVDAPKGPGGKQIRE